MKKLIREFLRILALISGWPVQLIFFCRKTYYEDKAAQGRKVKGSAIVISNHISIMDFMLFLFVFPARKLRCLIAEVMYNKGKLLRFVLDCMGGIFVDRTSYDMGFIDSAVDALEDGDLVGIFPEGKLEDGAGLIDFKPSYILIALRSGAPIIPCAHDGTYKLFRRTNVIIGKPVNLSDYCQNPNPTKEEIDTLNRMMRKRVADLQKLLEEKKKAAKTKPNVFSLLFWDFGRFCTFLFNIGFRIKVHGKENLKIKGKYIIASNHPGFFDPVIVMCTFWRRRLNMLAAKEVFGHGFRGFMLRHIGCVPIDREIFDLESFKKCKDILTLDGALVVFPEGHRNRTDALQDFKSGAALLGATSGAPILPFYMEKRKSPLRRTHVFIGEPITTSSDGGILPMGEVERINRETYEQMKNLEREAENYAG